jgi:Domain of unknown function (DUF1583_N)/Protein of unknown function (DUF1581)
MSRSQGLGVPHWYRQDGALVHLPGHLDDYLTLRTPLRGDFEVSCELRLQDWREASIVYGSHRFELSYDRKSYKLHTTVRHNGREVAINPPLPAAPANAYRFKLSVKDGWLRATIDGREVAAERIGPMPVPWLMVFCPAQHTGEVRDLKITGTPTVPAEVDLLAGDELGLWRPYLGYMATNDVRYANANGYWMKRGEEMYTYGRKTEASDGRPAARYYPESAIHYQRPLLEDGVIDYEFFYDPDRVHAHPMLDRLVFLLEPDGVKLHWLTDGASDKSGVPVDNATDEPSCRRGPAQLPLKAKAWNKVCLTVAGDTVKVALNGVDVYERPIEPTNQRFFGIFQYTDRAEARVRSMTYTGDWPKQLPASDRLFESKK